MSANKGYSRERRLSPRHRLSIPIKYRLWKSALPERTGESLDISEGGIYFVTNAMLEEGEMVELRFSMPEEIANEPSTEWRCTGRVVRTEAIGGMHGRLGVRVRFDCYEVERPKGTTSIQLDLNALRFGPAPGH